MKKIVLLAFVLAFSSVEVVVGFVWPVVAEEETIYIRADGNVEPDTAPISTVDNVTYIFTDNIYDKIVVERDNILVDGAGYAVEGSGLPGPESGISLTGRSDVTIRNMEIKAFSIGIYVRYSSNNSIFGNNITNNFGGIKLLASLKNSISENNIKENMCGIRLLESSGNTISGNNLKDNRYGIEFALSSNNAIVRNNVINNIRVGVELEYSSNNSVTGNNVVNTYDGDGIYLLNSSSNNISGNNITDNWRGVALFWSSDNNFYHNNFINNTQQVYDESWEDPYFPPSINVWDNGYPSGGNYWSDYAEKYQDARGLDGSGIWNTPYVIDDNNQDNYPLMSPWSPKTPEEVPFWMRWWFWTVIAVVIIALAGTAYFLKKRKPPTPTAPLPPPESTLQNIIQKS